MATTDKLADVSLVLFPFFVNLSVSQINNPFVRSKILGLFTSDSGLISGRKKDKGC